MSPTRRAILAAAVAAGGVTLGTGRAAIASTVPALPGELLDLSYWYLGTSTDTDGDGNSDSIYQPELDTYTTDRFRATSTSSAVCFRPRADGVTTSGSSYPREELREMEADGRTKAAWNPASGRHSMKWRVTTSRLPVVKPDMIMGQVHTGSDDLATLHLSGRTLTLKYDGTTVKTLTSSYVLNTYFDAEWVVENGRLMFYYNGVKVLDRAAGWSQDTCYFKAGAYMQSNVARGEDPTTTGEVKIAKNSLLVVHTA